MKYNCLVETCQCCRDENSPRADSSQLWGLANLEQPETLIYATFKTPRSHKHQKMEGSPQKVLGTSWHYPNKLLNAMSMNLFFLFLASKGAKPDHFNLQGLGINQDQLPGFLELGN
jgi:hypothetical protein